ncbi:hypothetical protein CN204_04420 [Sinorhizobium meliloti]|uniref:hypothetical protein n=1 Tax=Rhizobium meliloti TaxID=382 RepID=UPI000FD72F54|nr:hypothetical protein [Sinorhizobium meliloti]RVH87779.1 hypothetical protein CN204_04420 [Sinorhizobium meliloti]
MTDRPAIKPLEWSSHEGDGVLTADSVAGEYRVRCHNGDFWIASRDGIPLSNRPYELSSFAKAAAQADYEARILSALTQPERKAEAVAKIGELLSDENALEDAAKAAFTKAQSVYRADHDHFPLKHTRENAHDG